MVLKPLTLIVVAWVFVASTVSALAENSGRRIQDTEKIESLQLQLMEATRRAAEVAAEDARKTAEMGIAQTNKTAETAINAAKDANETIKTVFQWGASLIGAIVALGALIGWQQLSSVKKAYQDLFQVELDKFRDTAQKKAHEQVVKVTQVSIDIARCVLDIDLLKKETVQAQIEIRAKTLLKSLEEVCKKAEELGDVRTQGWTMIERAMAFYKLKDYQSAYSWQLKGSSKEFNPMDWPDRYQNQVCFAALIYSVDNARTDMLDRGEEIIREACPRIPGLAKEMYQDDDVRILLKARVPLQQLIFDLIPLGERANLTSPPLP